MNPYSVRARFRDDGARNDAQYMSLLGDTLRTQRTAKPCSAIWEASRAAGDGRSLSLALGVTPRQHSDTARGYHE